MANIGDQLFTPETGYKRIDDTNAFILKSPAVTGQYSGQIVSSACYNGSTYQMLEGTIKFYVCTSKLRIIGFRSTATMYSNNIEVYIDGVKNGSFSNLGESIIYQCLIYDCKIENGIHEVVIKNGNSGAYVNFDAIDIDDNGYIMGTPAQIGDQLLQPEPGWKRIDDTNTKITYINPASSAGGNTGYWNSTFHTIHGDKTSKIIFYVYTSRIRIIDYVYDVYSDRMIISIDGKEEIYSQKMSPQTLTLTYEKNMVKAIHKIEISSDDMVSAYRVFDAFDIDDDGYLTDESEYVPPVVDPEPPLPEDVLDFPIKVSDDTITSESDVATYAATIINGEKQLLVVDKLKSMYITNGSGGYSQVSKVIDFDNKETLDKFKLNDNNKLTWNDSILYTEEDIETLNIKATNIVVNIKDGDINTTKTLQEILDDILTNGIQITTKAVCGTAICGSTTCGDL